MSCPGPYLGWIANLLNNLVDLLDGQLHNTLIHPSGYFQLLNEHILDVRYDLVAELLSFL
jgi:hypothetical protein